MSGTDAVRQPPPQQGATHASAPGPGGQELPQIPRNMYAVREGADYQRKNRTIVVCLDGTGDKFDEDNSNIVHLVSCLKKADPSQLIYYQSGIGTYDGGGLSNGVNAALDMAVGAGLGVHVRDAYQFLMENFHQGDKICLFGFSRGAYTARCLAGMVHKVGLLPAHNRAQVPFAYQFYKDDSPKGWQMSAFFKRTFCMDVSVHFVGVFDSVASVGLIPRKLPLSATPFHQAAYFRHAMALDERRSKFKACRFRTKSRIDEKSWDVQAEKEDLNPGSRANANSVSTLTASDHTDDPKVENRPMTAKKRWAPKVQHTDALEVWFAGCHCDVGGGAVANEERHKLAQIPLRWMIRQCFACDTGIIFKAQRLAEEGIDVQMLYPVYTPLDRPTENVSSSLRQRFEGGNLPPIQERASILRPVKEDEPEGLHYVDIDGGRAEAGSADVWLPEQTEDYFDAVQPMRDQLKIKMMWWILEFIPIKVRVQPKDADVWLKKVRMNLGRYRPVQEKNPNLHWTVEERMRSKGYKINARMEKNAEWRIVA